MQDRVLFICKQLVKMDNRTNSELAEASGLTTPTIKKLREGVDISYVRSTTVSALVKALHRHIELRG